MATISFCHSWSQILIYIQTVWFRPNSSLEELSYDLQWQHQMLQETKFKLNGNSCAWLHWKTVAHQRQKWWRTAWTCPVMGESWSDDDEDGALCILCSFTLTHALSRWLGLSATEPGVRRKDKQPTKCQEGQSVLHKQQSSSDTYLSP